MSQQTLDVDVREASATTTTPDTDLTFEKPGPGTWTLDQSHWSRPFSRWMQVVYPPAMEEGFGQSMAHYGALLDAPRVEPVNGFLYISMRPAVGPAESESPPPKLLFKLLTWLHPTMRRRNTRMAETFETKRWRADLERWDEEWKPQRLAENRELQAVDPASLSDEELASHLETVRTAASEAIVLHHRMDLCPLLPTGDFLAHGVEWTDRTPSELLGLFDGASEISAGAVAELEALVDAIRADPDAASILTSDRDPATILDDLRAHSHAVEDALDAWLDVVGYRIISGYDVADIYALEDPAMLVQTIRGAVEEDFDGSFEHTSTELYDDIREEVPPAHRETFDALYEEARLTYRARDERSLHDLWTLGLARRGLLEAGRRLAANDRLHDPEHAVDLEPDEVVSLLRGGPGPTADEVAAYVEYRTTHDNSDAPAQLGPDAAQPPAEWLPGPAQRGMLALTTMIDHLLESSDVESDATTVRGIGASDGSYEGPVRIVRGPADFSSIQDGDVLVAETTSPAFNVVLPLLGAVVTDHGGTLSHAAIVAREFDIPGVVGCTDATDRLETGMRVVVNGDAGTVEITE